MKNYKDKQWLEKKYISEKLSLEQVGKLCNVGSSIIFHWMKKYNIPTRSNVEAHLGNIPWNKGIKTGHIPWNKGKFYSEEIRIKMRKPHKGFIPWNKGKTGIYSEKILKNMRDIRKGKHFSPKTEFKKGILLSKKHKQNIGIALRGEKSSFWKGGITPLVLLIRNNFKYRQWRDDIFTRDNFTCQECGVRGHNLNAHHIKPFSKIIQFYEITTLEEAIQCDELWNINNGITLCEKCHIKIHINKKYNFELVGEI